VIGISKSKLEEALYRFNDIRNLEYRISNVK
jgi:hypothetical protein